MLTRVAALLALGLGGLFAVLPRADAHDAAHADTKSNKSSGIPVWALALGVVAGVVVGGAGGKFIGQKK